MGLECEHYNEITMRVGKVERDIEVLRDKIVEIDKTTSVTSQSILCTLKNLENLPSTMSEISDTMIRMQSEISKSNEKVGELDVKFNSLNNRMILVDEDGKFNFRKWIGKNAVAIAVGITALMGYGAWWISNLFR